MRTSCRAERLGWDQELGEKLAAAELEVLHLDQFFKQVILKYKEERRKLEEKVSLNPGFNVNQHLCFPV